MPEVLMPRLADAMEEGTVLAWLKADGDEVSAGEELVEIETDKASMTYVAEASGRLRIVVQEGATVSVGAQIAELGAASAPGLEPPQINGRGDLEPVSQRVELHPEQGPSLPGGDRRVKASPVARRMARDRGLDLRGLSGTGPAGRVVKADVETAASSKDADALTDEAIATKGGEAGLDSPAKPAAATTGSKGEVETEPLSRVQQVIARRMAEAKATVPDFALEMTVDMEEAAEFRARLQSGGKSGPTPSFNDMIIKACALTLRDYPFANGSYTDGQFVLHSRINVGMAVTAARTLLVPTIFDADGKGLGQIAAESRELAAKVRAGTVLPSHLSGGTFTVSNLGMFGVTQFTAVINPPQAAILAVGMVEPTPVVRDGVVVARNVMRMTLTCDHRILYGAEAAQFLAHVRDLLEQPLRMLL